jgi:hypothetical protein
MSLDNALWFAGIVIEAVVLGLLLYRSVWRKLPVFSAYCAWDLLINMGNYTVRRFFSASYLTVYLVETVVDSALQFSILVELAWSVLRPLRAFLSRRTLIGVGVLIVAAGAAIWPFATIAGLGHLSVEELTLVRLQQTVSILRIAFFLALAGCSQLLSIGWRDRELQVATGLGFYSLVGIAVAALNTRPEMGPHYGLMNQAVIASYLCSLLYWVFCFAQKEAARREFTPQMQSLLLAVAGSARKTRIGLDDSVEEPGKRKSGDR